MPVCTWIHTIIVTRVSISYSNNAYVRQVVNQYMEEVGLNICIPGTCSSWLQLGTFPSRPQSSNRPQNLRHFGIWHSKTGQHAGFYSQKCISMHLAILGNALSFCQLQSCPQPKVSAAALGERFRISIVGILWNSLVTMSTACASKRYIEALNQKPWSILIQCFQCQVCKCTVRTGHMSKPQTLQGRGWSVERHIQLESGLGCTFWKEPKTGRDGRQV